jgi:phosphohistidine phosphatase
MKRLMLLRHAKAEAATGDDRNRALIARGRNDSVRMGRFLREERYVPERILCSDARRARETLERMLPELHAEPATQFLRELYLAEPEAVLAVIRSAPDRTNLLLVVGHNPGLEQCAAALAVIPLEKKLRKRLEAMEEKFPTCALVVLDFEIAKWREVAPGKGELDAFVRPKDLE